MASLMMKAVALMLRLGKSDDPNAPTPSPAPITAALRKSCEINETDFEGLPVYDIVPRGQKPTKTLLYLHGGGYKAPILNAHWWLIRRLATENNIRVVVPFYQLTPKGTHRDAFPRMLRYYKSIVDTADQIYLAGDSAGGGFALALAQNIRDAGLTAPTRLFLFSPWVDATMTNPDIQPLVSGDVMLSLAVLDAAGKAWAGEDPTDLPEVSPIYGKLAGLPPMDVFLGTHEMFLPDCRKLGELGTDVRVHEYPGGFHVFVAVVRLAESRQARAIIKKALETGR